MLFLALLTVLISSILPAWFLLILLYLGVRIIEGQLNLPSLITLGDADILISDLIIITVLFRVLLRTSSEKHVLGHVRADFLPGLIAFVAVMIFSVGLAKLRFGQEVFLPELVSLLRFLGLQIGGFILLVVSLRRFKDVQRAQKAVRWLGYFAAISIYLGLLLRAFGMTVGEINVSETFVRYQGVLGDSVKLFLLPFIFLEVLSARLAGAVFLLVALMATGGRIGFVGLLVGLAVIMVLEGEKVLKARYFSTFTAVAIAISIGLWLDVGGIFTRFLHPLEMGVGLGQRVATWNIAFAMASENVLTGLGFGGYRLFVDSYSPGDSSFPPLLTGTFSQVLKAAVDGGVFGLATFLWMMSNFLTVMKTSMSTTQGELNVFLKAGYVFVVTMIILSPIVAWMLPASKISYLLFSFIAIGAGLLRMRGRDELQPNLLYGMN